MKATGKHTSRNAPERAGTRGFTLIELMVVLVILALLAGMVAPSAIGAMRRNGVESRGGELVELLRFAQRYAITSHHPTQANFDSSRGRCWVASVTTALPWLEREHSGESEVLASLQLPQTMTLSLRREEAASGGDTPWQTVTFTSDGRAENAVLRLADAQGMAFEITVMGSDGSVQRREGGPP